MGNCDLHIHSTASDGNLTPAQVVQLAAEKKIHTLALADHDTIEGYLEAQTRGDKIGVTVLPGVELTCNFNSRESHLLGYCFDTENEELNEILDKHHLSRKKRIRWILAQLADQGFQISFDEVWAEAHGGNLGRPHIAAVMVDKRMVASKKEAFIRYLGDNALGEIPNSYLNYRQAINLIKKAGGVTILAHPGLMYTNDEIKAFIDAGLDGVEIIHPSHNYKLQKKLENLAENHSLLKTGGSDFHALNGEYEPHLGIVTISEKWVNQLVKLSKQRQQIIV